VGAQHAEPALDTANTTRELSHPASLANERPQREARICILDRDARTYREVTWTTSLVASRDRTTLVVGGTDDNYSGQHWRLNRV
jgi:hypothetical protein